MLNKIYQSEHVVKIRLFDFCFHIEVYYIYNFECVVQHQFLLSVFGALLQRRWHLLHIIADYIEKKISNFCKIYHAQIKQA